MEKKNHSMFRVVTHCLGAFRHPVFFKHRYPVGGQAPPPSHTHTHTPGTEACIETSERITICVWRRGGGGGERFVRKYKEI